MVIDIALLVLWAISLLGIIVMVVRKFPLIAQLNVSSMREVRENAIKKDIVADRLYRKLSEKRLVMKKIFAPLIQGLKAKFHELYGKIASLERHYRMRAKGANAEDTGKTQHAITNLVQEIDGLISDARYQEAERKLIEVISLDHRSIDAYKRLGKLYAIQRNKKHAEESLLFALKLNPQDVEIYNDLASIYVDNSHFDKARAILEKAKQKEPNNPKILNQLVELCIKMNDKLAAEENLREFRSANPENNKITELEEIIKEMRL